VLSASARVLGNLSLELKTARQRCGMATHWQAGTRVPDSEQGSVRAIAELDFVVSNEFCKAPNFFSMESKVGIWDGSAIRPDRGLCEQVEQDGLLAEVLARSMDERPKTERMLYELSSIQMAKRHRAVSQPITNLLICGHSVAPDFA
jgi:hypothetical protein